MKTMWWWYHPHGENGCVHTECLWTITLGAPDSSRHNRLPSSYVQQLIQEWN